MHLFHLKLTIDICTQINNFFNVKYLHTKYMSANYLHFKITKHHYNKATYSLPSLIVWISSSSSVSSCASSSSSPFHLHLIQNPNLNCSSWFPVWTSSSCVSCASSSSCLRRNSRMNSQNSKSPFSFSRIRIPTRKKPLSCETSFLLPFPILFLNRSQAQSLLRPK